MFLISFYVKKITLNLIEERGNLEEKLTKEFGDKKCYRN
jgi:hypothetical protein